MQFELHLEVYFHTDLKFSKIVIIVKIIVFHV